MSSLVRWSATRPSCCLKRGSTWANATLALSRSLHVDGRSRLSNIWVPSGGIAVSENEDAHAKLIRAGFIRQSHSGIFHLLPLGRRVQSKLASLVGINMHGLGASDVELSSISSESLWEESGRLHKIGSELFRFTDRKDGRYLLSPTHEEEITTLVARSVQSYKSLPLRLYQTTRKYRDELRPRHGLLRGREFVMKDLYTFDYSIQAALKTYEEVREAYSNIFIKQMKLPILVAKASSGDMGGDLSHEYHIPTALGEDHVINCNGCDYVANEEVAEAHLPSEAHVLDTKGVSVWRGVSKDRKTLVNVWYPESISGSSYSKEDINTHAVKLVVPELDSGVEDPLPFWWAALKPSKTEASPRPEETPTRLVNVFDYRLPSSIREQLGKANITPDLPIWPEAMAAKLDTSTIPSLISSDDPSNPSKPMNLLRIKTGDPCPHCNSGTLNVQKAIELGHTFHLGTRYSVPLNASVTVPTRLLTEEGSSPDNTTVESQTIPLQMGCHGIGISRTIGAVANHLSDARGLNWPRAIAPYEVVVVARDDSREAEKVFDALRDARFQPPEDDKLRMAWHEMLDPVLDDRMDSLPSKLKDADLIGYPVIVVLGREWKASTRVEVQCRRLGVKEFVGMEGLPGYVKGLLDQL